VRKKSRKLVLIVATLFILALAIFAFKNNFLSIIISTSSSEISDSWYVAGDINSGYGKYFGNLGCFASSTPNTIYTLGNISAERVSFAAKYLDTTQSSSGCFLFNLKINGVASKLAIEKQCTWSGCIKLDCKSYFGFNATDESKNQYYYVTGTSSPIIALSDKLSMAVSEVGGCSSSSGGGIVYVKMLIHNTGTVGIDVPHDTSLLFENELKIINVTYNNNVGNNVIGSLKINYIYETPTGLKNEVVYTDNYTLALGANIIQITIPTEANGKLQLEITPIYYVQGSAKMNNIPKEQAALFTSAGYTCIRTNDEHVACGKVLPKAVEGASQSATYLINPKPIYMESDNGGCLSGYTYQAGSALCIRNDIIDNQLTCMQLGCPVIGSHEYACSSAGICTETVFVQKNCTDDNNCSLGTKCDIGSGLCIKTEIYNIILQCDTSGDCSTPCVGKSISCVANKCVYAGDCSATTIGCNELGCADGFTCDKVRNVCFETQKGGFVLNNLEIALILLAVIAAASLLLYYRRR